MALYSLIESAKANGHNPYAYLRDVLTRLDAAKALARLFAEPERSAQSQRAKKRSGGAAAA